MSPRAPRAGQPAPAFSDDDRRHMALALRLAARAAGRTSPNPMVGTVIVRDGEVLATGYHRKAGLAHAEVDALRKLGGRAEGATLYVNLEPCNHRGRTEPCTDALLASGVRRVVVGMIDPNPIVNGSGRTRLRRAGIAVEVGCLAEESRRLNEGFVSVMERGRPFVRLKLAATLDGHTATRTGDSRWITGERSRALVHRWRALHDAVLIGSGTALRDDPLLTVRSARGRDPVRVVADAAARLAPDAAMLRDGPRNVLIAVTARAPKKRVAALTAAGAEVLVLPATRAGEVDLHALLRALARRGLNSVLCEGGATLAGALVREGLADELALFHAPKVLGGGAPVLAGEGPAAMRDALPLADVRTQRIGEDLLVRGRLTNAGPARDAR